MSKIGKKPISLPKDVQVKVDDSFIYVKGPKGELKRSLPDGMGVKIDVESLAIEPRNREDRAMWGLTRALVRNMVRGVSDGFEEVLEFQGVGYKATVKGNDLEMGLGYSHPITIKAPEGITFKVEKNVVRIQGIDNELIGKVATEIREWRRPEPYKGSGIRYQGEIIKKKAGKKAVAAG